MAQPDLMNFRVRRMLVAAAGTDPLLPATHALKLYDGESQIEADETELNEDSEFLGNVETELANFRAYIQGNIHIQPPVTPGDASDGHAPHAPVILPCGFAETLNAGTGITRYNPISSSFPLADANWYHNDTICTIRNARGNLSALTMQIGQRFTAQVRIEGSNDDDVQPLSMPTGFDLDAFTRPVISTHDNSTLIINTIDADTPIVNLHLRGKSLVADLGNTLGTHEYTEFKATEINDRRPTFTVRVAMMDLGDFNPWEHRRSRTFMTFAYKTVYPDGRYAMLRVRGQIGNVTRVDIDGKTGVEITGRCVPSNTGGDELFIEFGDDTLRMVGTAPASVESVAYTFTPTTLGSYTGPLTYTISAGALPDGLTINASTGAITGDPDVGEAAGSPYAATITVTDSTPGTPKTATLAISIVVTA